MKCDITWNDARDVGDHNRLAEDGSVENVSDGAIGALPHLLEIEL